MRPLLACLVHEKPDCVLDLVKNLRALNPDAAILLYNGGLDPALLTDPALGRFGAMVHPSPRRQEWGRLHEFAVDCMAFALERIPFDFMTIVDSDQLGLRTGYTDAVARFMEAHPRCGVAGSSDAVYSASATVGPVQVAWRELDLWKPLLRQFANGESQFARWTFWPSTIITRDCSEALVRLFRESAHLQELLNHSKLWATEEILFPTLAALLGFEVHRSPATYEYVRYRERYSPGHVDLAFHRSDAYWIHPVNRDIHDPLRRRVREKLRYDERLTEVVHFQPAQIQPVNGHSDHEPPLLLMRPIFEAVRRVEGWLEEDEADLLMAACGRALDRHRDEAALVEIGSYCGRSTVALASVIRSRSPRARLHAIDPHEGTVGASGIDLQTAEPTYTRFQANIRAAGVEQFIQTIRQRSYEVQWNGPVSFLFVDGLHDYENVSRDFRHFEPHLTADAWVAFHDYADYYPGVRRFVDELLAGGGYERVALSRSLLVVRRLSTAAQPAPQMLPLVTCIMATCDRRSVASKAIDYFKRQSYPNRELIVMDDGTDAIEDLLPPDPRIRYIRMPHRRTMGAKHNLCCEAAAGEIIVHWDDDDWMSDSRLDYQVTALMKRTERSINGLSRLFFLDPVAPRAWEYIYSQGMPSWIAGGTFCYRKSLWQHHRFEDISEGADTRFIWSLQGAEIEALEDNSFYVATVHPRNTSPKHTRDARWHPLPLDRIRSLMHNDWDFYEHWPIR
jgi:predicted O-methyltransferase YrrM